MNRNPEKNNNTASSEKKPNSSEKTKKPAGPKVISKTKYFKIGIRDSARVRIIKEGMNHLFDERNRELEEAFLQEATQYTERVLGESRRFHFNEEEDHEAMDVIFNNTIEEVAGGEEEGAGLEVEEIIDGQEEERLEAEAEQELEESETLDSEEVLALEERIRKEYEEEYERIRAELDEEEEANKDN